MLNLEINKLNFKRKVVALVLNLTEFCMLQPINGVRERSGKEFMFHLCVASPDIVAVYTRRAELKEVVSHSI